MELNAMICMIVCMLLNWGAMILCSIKVVQSERKAKEKELS